MAGRQQESRGWFRRCIVVLEPHWLRAPIHNFIIISAGQERKETLDNSGGRVARGDTGMICRGTDVCFISPLIHPGYSVNERPCS